MEGGADTGFHHVEPEKYTARLMHFSGKGINVVVKEVIFRLIILLRYALCVLRSIAALNACPSVRLAVCLFVTFVICGYIGWVTPKVINVVRECGM